MTPSPCTNLQPGDDGLDCDEVPCHNIHLALSWLSLVCCAYAVVATSCTYVWLCQVPKVATRDFFQCFPNCMAAPSWTLILGVFFWAADFFFIMVVHNGIHTVLWLAIPSLLLAGHFAVTFVRMRHFAWTWPNNIHTVSTGFDLLVDESE